MRLTLAVELQAYVLNMNPLGATTYTCMWLAKVHQKTHTKLYIRVSCVHGNTTVLANGAILDPLLCVYVCMYVYMYKCVCVCVCVCVSMNICVYICICMPTPELASHILYILPEPQWWRHDPLHSGPTGTTCMNCSNSKETTQLRRTATWEKGPTTEPWALDLHSMYELAITCKTALTVNT